MKDFTNHLAAAKAVLRKLYCFACVCVAALALIGGVAYLFYFHKPLFAVAVLCLAGMAVPFVVARVKELLA